MDEFPEHADGVPLPAAHLRSRGTHLPGRPVPGREDPEFVSAPGVITMRGVAGGILFCALVILFRCFNVTMLAGQCARSLLS